MENAASHSTDRLEWLLDQALAAYRSGDEHAAMLLLAEADSEARKLPRRAEPTQRSK